MFSQRLICIAHFLCRPHVFCTHISLADRNASALYILDLVVPTKNCLTKILGRSMKAFLCFLVFFCVFVRCDDDDEAPPIELVEVEGLYDITHHHALKLKPGTPVMFRLRQSDTFLAQKQLEFWDVERLLDESVPVQHDAKVSSEWVEWGYEDYEVSEFLHNIPVSLCHSELEGEGGAIYFRSIVATDRGRGASFGITPKAYGNSLALSSSVLISEALAISTTLTCSAKHGEIVQVFLRNTHFLYFTPKFRVLAYNRRENRFAVPQTFTRQPRQKEVVANGVGDWVCGSSSVMNLMCDSVVDDVRNARDSVPEEGV